MEYPTKSWLKKKLQTICFLYAPYGCKRLAGRMQDAFIIGSEAKGTSNNESDLDIAIILRPNKYFLSSLVISSLFHEGIPDGKAFPLWQGRRIDFQFFYPDDPELKEYAKIHLEE